MTNMFLHILLATFLLFPAVNAFAPVSRSGPLTTNTALQFGFLKELGLEKPDWLPDFGGKKEEAPAEEAPAEEGDEAEAEAVEE